MPRLIRLLFIFLAALLLARQAPAQTISGPAPRAADTINARDFGARGDGTTDDWWAIQQAMDYVGAHGGGIVRVSRTAASVYRIAQALRAVSHVHLVVDPGVTVKCTGDYAGTDPTGAHNLQGWPTYGCWLGGALTVSAVNSNPTYAAGAIARGQKAVTLSTASNTAYFVVGDIILVQTPASQDWYVGTDTRPHWGMLAQITAIDAGTGTLTLDRPIEPDAGYSASLVRKMTNGAGTAGWPTLQTSADTGIPDWVAIDAGFIGGKWVAGDAQGLVPLIGDAGGLDCIMEPDSVAAGYGLGVGNLYQSCRLSARHEIIAREGVEMAYLSSNNTLHIGTLVMSGQPTDRPTMTSAVKLNEGGHDNVVQIGTLKDYIGDVTPSLLLGGTVTAGGGDVLTATVTSPQMNGGASVSASYTTVAGDTLQTAVAGLAAAVNANATISGAGIVASTPTTYAADTVMFTAPAGVQFQVAGNGTVNGLYLGAQGHDVVVLRNGYRNTVRIGAMSGGTITGYVVDVASDSTGSDTIPATDGNTVTLGQSDFDYQNGYAITQGARATRNLVQHGRFMGSVWQEAAFDLAYGVGGYNVFRDLKGFGATAAAECLQNDPTNLLEDIYAPAAPTLRVSAASVNNVSYCTRRRVADAAYAALLQSVAEYTSWGTVTSGGNFYVSTTVPANSIESLDAFSVVAAGTVTGTSQKTGDVAFRGCVVNYVIPGDATNWRIRFRADANTAYGIRCQGVVQSDSPTSPRTFYIGTSGASWSSAGNWEFKVNAPTGSDTLTFSRLSGRPLSPFFDNSALLH